MWWNTCNVTLCKALTHTRARAHTRAHTSWWSFILVKTVSEVKVIQQLSNPGLLNNKWLFLVVVLPFPTSRFKFAFDLSAWTIQRISCYWIDLRKKKLSAICNLTLSVYHICGLSFMRVVLFPVWFCYHSDDCRCVRDHVRILPHNLTGNSWAS